MTINELKIGDWVLVDGKSVMLDELPNDTLTFYNSETGFCKDYDYYDLKPVPLTKEILEKNGWVYNKRECEYRLEHLSLEPYNSKDGKECFVVFARLGNDALNIHDIKFVHELQHILWALGVDDNMTIE